jgi:hypothetical protein
MRRLTTPTPGPEAPLTSADVFLGKHRVASMRGALGTEKRLIMCAAGCFEARTTKVAECGPDLRFGRRSSSSSRRWGANLLGAVLRGYGTNGSEFHWRTVPRFPAVSEVDAAHRREAGNAGRGLAGPGRTGWAARCMTAMTVARSPVRSASSSDRCALR